LAKAQINAGICGFQATVITRTQDDLVTVEITSDCPAIQKLSQNLTQVDPFQEISFRRNIPQTIQAAMKYCTHAACPVPSGIIKAIEVEAGLALPADVSITIEADKPETG
jgi:hypothetical protein